VSTTLAINPCQGFLVISGVVDTGHKFTTHVNDTGEQLSPVTTTLAINLLLVTRTRKPWRWGAAKDRRKLKGTNRRYLRLSKSDTAADGVIGTAIKSCIHGHPTHPDKRPLRPPKLNVPFLFEVVLAASEASDQGEPMLLFMMVPMTISAAGPTLAAGDITVLV
jgi:hypothetical protein